MAMKRKIDGSVEITGTLNTHTIPSGTGTLALTSDIPPASTGVELDQNNSGDFLRITSANTSYPELHLKQTELVASNSNGPRITLEKQRYDSINSNRNGDELGRIDFAGFRNGNVSDIYGSIIGVSAIDNNPGPAGWIEFEVSDMNTNGTTKYMTIFGGTAASQFDEGVRIDNGNLWLGYNGTRTGSIMLEGQTYDLEIRGTGTETLNADLLLPREGGTVVTSNNFSTYIQQVDGSIQIQLDDDGTSAPSLLFYKNSATPADEDPLGLIQFYGEDSASVKEEFARIQARATDVTNGTEDGRIDFYTKVDGSITQNGGPIVSIGAMDDISHLIQSTGIQINSGNLFLSDTTSGEARIIFGDTTLGAIRTSLAVESPTVDRTITFPDKSGTVALLNDIGAPSATLLYTLDNPNNFGSVSSDYFGDGVAISGKYIAVGAYGEDYGSVADDLNGGIVYIYERDTGTLMHTISNPDTFNNDFSTDEFGRYMSMSGNYLLVSANGDQTSQDDGTGSGAVYVFNVLTGQLIHSIETPTGSDAYSATGLFGLAVDISDEYFVVGAPYDRDYANPTLYAQSGQVHVYDNASGNLLYTLANPNHYDTPTNDYFGHSVAISGHWIAVGAWGEDEVGATASGVVYVYDMRNFPASPTQISSADYVLENPNAYSSAASDQFGYRAAMDGNHLIVTAYEEDDDGGDGSGGNVGTGSGKVYYYNLQNLSTSPVTSADFVIDNPNVFGGTQDDAFGYKLSMSGNLALIGAIVEDKNFDYTENSGAAYVYDVTKFVTSPITEADIVLENPNDYSSDSGDRFSSSLDISGNHMVISASFEDATTGTSSGRAYVYKLENTNEYVPSGKEIASYSLGQSGGGGGTYGNTDVDTHLNTSTASSGQYLSWSGTDYDWVTHSYSTLLSSINTWTAQQTIAGPQTALIINDSSYGIQFGDNVLNVFTFEGYVNDSSETFVRVEEPTQDNILYIPNRSGTLATVDQIPTSIEARLIYTLNNPNINTGSGSAAFDHFGMGVKINGNYIIVNASQEDDVETGRSVAGYMYVYDAKTGELLHSVANPGEDYVLGLPRAINDGTDFGGYNEDAMDMSGNHMIVGVKSADIEANADGVAYIFDLKTGKLKHVLFNETGSGTNDLMGHTCRIDGNIAAVSVSQDSAGSGGGSVNIYDVPSGKRIRNIQNPNSQVGSLNLAGLFGEGLALSGKIVAIGSHTYSTGGVTNRSGRVYLYNALSGELLQTIDNPNAYSTVNDDYFGEVIAMDGPYLVVGTYQEDDADGASSGKVYVFDVDTGSLLHTLDNPDNTSGAGDQFGYHVAISGNYIAVGAPFNDDQGTSSGKAYVFDARTGDLVCEVENPNKFGTPNDDRFSKFLSISGNRLIVGADGEDETIDGTTYSFSGKAYVFHLSGVETYSPSLEEFDQLAIAAVHPYPQVQLKHAIENPRRGDTIDNFNEEFGAVIDISKDYFIVGSPYDDPLNTDGTAGSGQGTAYIYETDSGKVKHHLINPNSYANTSTTDYFGNAVAISGNYAAIGAKFEELPNPSSFQHSSAGVVYIYNVTTGEKVHTLATPEWYESPFWNDIDSARFGDSLAMDGRNLIVGASYNDMDNTRSGRAYIFDAATGTHIHTFINPNNYNTGFDDYFGGAVDISGNYAIVGATGEDSSANNNVGAAYLFEVDSGRLLHTFEHPLGAGARQSAFFGVAVATFENYSAIGSIDSEEGYQAGRVYIYDNESGNLLHILKNPKAIARRGYDPDPNYDPTLDIATSFGQDLSMNGYNLVVGARTEDNSNGVLGGGGTVYVYDVRTGELKHTISNPNFVLDPGQLGQAADYFGDGVAIHGNKILIGATQEKSQESDITAAGAVYVYQTHEEERPYTSEEVASFGGAQPIQNDLVVGKSVIREKSLSGVTTDLSKNYATKIFAQLALEVAVGSANFDYYNRVGGDVVVDKLLEFDKVTNRRYIDITGHQTNGNNNLAETHRGIQFIQFGYNGAAGTIVIHCKSHGFSSGDEVKIVNGGSVNELNGNVYGVFPIDDDRFILYTDSTLATEVDGSTFSRFVSFTGYEFCLGNTDETIQPSAQDSLEWLNLGVDFANGYYYWDTNFRTAAATTFDAFYNLEKEIKQDFQKYSNYTKTFTQNNITYTNVPLFDDNPGLGNYDGAGDITIGNGGQNGQVINLNSPMIFPSFTTTERNAISNAVAGMVIWNTSTSHLEFYNGSNWRQILDGPV